MKTLLLLISFTMITSESICQGLGDDFYNLTFEDTNYFNHLRIDSITNQNNLWQIGTPQKTLFTGAYSPAKAIVTDLSDPYPVNDTSVFTIVNVATGYGWIAPHTVILSGYYYVNSDTLTDYGKIEVSPDNGTTWIDIVNDTAYSGYINWGSAMPVLTGNSNGWQLFTAYLQSLGPLFNVQINDTILYRFTFISDSIQTNKDGLMFDDFHFEDYVEAINEIENKDLITVFPNPASDQLNIQRKNVSGSSIIQILDYTGQLLEDFPNYHGELINIRQLPNGMYFLKYSDTKNFTFKKFIVQH